MWAGGRGPACPPAARLAQSAAHRNSSQVKAHPCFAAASARSCIPFHSARCCLTCGAGGRQGRGWARRLRRRRRSGALQTSLSSAAAGAAGGRRALAASAGLCSCCSCASDHSRGVSSRFGSCRRYSANCDLSCGVRGRGDADRLGSAQPFRGNRWPRKGRTGAALRGAGAGAGATGGRAAGGAGATARERWRERRGVGCAPRGPFP